LVFRLLILILAGLLLVGCVPHDKVNSCRQCHTVHYPERGECTLCHRGDPRSLRPAIAHHGLIPGRFAYFTDGDDVRVKAGEQLLQNSACRRCHTTGAKGGRLASNLDRFLAEADPAKVVKAIREPVFFMPDFHFADYQFDLLLNALLANSSRTAGPVEEIPRSVHFTQKGEEELDPFSKHCGGCHRLLSQRFGALGSGVIGPNLSGLFTPFYPANFSQQMQHWNRDNLLKWLKNPRTVRPLTEMAPVLLTENEQEKLMEIFLDPTARNAAP